MSKLIIEKEILKNKKWEFEPLGNIITAIKGKRPKNLGNSSKEFTMPYITIESFEKKIFKKFSDGSKCIRCFEDDVLLVWDGSRSGLVGSGVSGIVGSTLMKLNGHGINKKYLYYFLKLNYDILNKNTKGIGIPHINTTVIWNLTFPIPPLNEQARIVEKIEELFSLIDLNLKIISDLEKKIVHFKHSLLQHTFQGNLTKKWRMSISDLKHGKEIIQQLKATNDKFIDIPSKKISLLSKIPLEWEWTYLINLGELSRGKSKHRPRNDPKLFGGKYPFIQTGIIRNSFHKIIKYDQTYNETGLKQSHLFPEGTLCITIAANIADTAILTFPSCFPDSIVGFIGIDKIISTWYVMYYIQSHKERLQSIAPATAQKNINLEILQNITIPIMSYDEQMKIVNELESGFSLTHHFSKTLKLQIQVYKNFKKSILKQAFEGKLVPQDPNDEPAEILLQKIKQEKEQLKQKEKSKRKKKNVK